MNIINPQLRGSISHTDFGSGLLGTENALFVGMAEEEYADMREGVDFSISPRDCDPCVVVLEEFGDVFDHLIIVSDEPRGGPGYYRVSDNIEGILTYGDPICRTGMWSDTWTEPEDFIYDGVEFGCAGKFANGGDYQRLKGNIWSPSRDLGGLNHEMGHWMGIGPNLADFPGRAGIPLRKDFADNAVVSWNSEDRMHQDSNSTIESPMSGPFWDPQRGWPYSVKLQEGDDLKEVQIRWNGDDTFRMVPRGSDQEVFDDIYLYMMGFLPPEQAGERYYFLVDAEINLDDCVSEDRGLICTDPIIDQSEYGTAVEFGVTEMISQFGPRSPAYEDALKDLNAAAIVLSNGPASEAERAWYDLLYGWWSTEREYDETLGASWPFATRGLSTITTGIPADSSSPSDPEPDVQRVLRLDEEVSGAIAEAGEFDPWRLEVEEDVTVDIYMWSDTGELDTYVWLYEGVVESAASPSLASNDDNNDAVRTAVSSGLLGGTSGGRYNSAVIQVSLSGGTTYSVVPRSYRDIGIGDYRLKVVAQAPTPTPAPTPAPDSNSLPISWVYAGRSTSWSEVSLNGTGENVITVSGGSDVSVYVNMSYTHTSGYCPGCIVQFYVRMNDVFTECLTNGGTYGGGSQSETFTFNAPTEAGTYYIQPAGTLQYSCQTGTSASETFGSSTLATVVVTE